MNSKSETLEDRIKRRAYAIWKEEGCPANREKAHWDMAAELVAIEDNQALTTQPVPQELGPSGEPAEPIEPAQNLGEFPTAFTDQGEQVYPPRRTAAPAEPPLSSDKTK